MPSLFTNDAAGRAPVATFALALRPLRAPGSGLPTPTLPTSGCLCYNHPAVDFSRNACAADNGSGSDEHKQGVEHPISFCPVCSRRLEPKRCKLVCRECGYYLSCSDYI
jgi:hypothetical protein